MGDSRSQWTTLTYVPPDKRLSVMRLLATFTHFQVRPSAPIEGSYRVTLNSLELVEGNAVPSHSLRPSPKPPGQSSSSVGRSWQESPSPEHVFTSTRAVIGVGAHLTGSGASVALTQSVTVWQSVWEFLKGDPLTLYRLISCGVLSHNWETWSTLSLKRSLRSVA
jgi:hypothetical protein